MSVFNFPFPVQNGEHVEKRVETAWSQLGMFCLRKIIFFNLCRLLGETEIPVSERVAFKQLVH